MNKRGQDYGNAYRARGTLRLPIKLCEVLDYEEAVIKDLIDPNKKPLFFGCCGSIKKKRYFVQDEFIKAFNKMSTQQKIALYCKTVDYLTRLSRGQESCNFHVENTEFDGAMIKFGLKERSNCLKLNPDQGTIEVFGKYPALIDLHEYIVRSSNNARAPNTLIIQAVRPGFVDAFRFRFKDEADYQKCFTSISVLSDKCLFESLRKELQAVNQFRMPLPQNQNLVAMRSREKIMSGKEMDNLIASYINEIVPCGITSQNEIGTEQFLSKFPAQDGSNYTPGSLVDSPYNLEELFDSSSYSSANDYSESLQQSKRDPLIFRITKGYDCCVEDLVSCFSDVDLYQKWNTQVKGCKILDLIKDQNSLVIQQIHKPLVKYYEARIFLYLRTLFVENDVVYIVDRTLNCPKSGDFQNFVVGRVVFAVWKICARGKEKCLLDAVIKLDHKMIKSQDIETRLTGVYMEGFLQVDQCVISVLQRDRKVFNMKYTKDKYTKFLQKVYSKPKPVEPEQITQPSKKQLIKVVDMNRGNEVNNPATKFGDDSFYSAMGASDWNSRVSNLSRLDSFKRIRESQMEKSRTARILSSNVIPIMESNSPDASGSSHDTHRNLVSSKTPSQQLKAGIDLKSSKHKSSFKKQTPSMSLIRKAESKESLPVVKLLPKILPVSTTPSQTDLYLSHMVKKSIVSLDKEGGCIIPQDYVTSKFPTVPKLTQPYLKMTGDTWNHYLLKDLWCILPNGELKCTNEVILKQQNGIFSSLCKKIATNVLTGKGLNLSLPVDIFSQLSTLQLTARALGFAPLFLERAAKADDPLQRMKLTICFSMGFSLSYLEMAKPFNPILGETYQGWINGCPIYCEQTSHHPPITSYLMIGRGYKAFGNLTSEMDISMNSAVGYNSGECVVQFDKYPNLQIYSRSPGGEIQGLAYGDRKFSFTGKSFYYDDQGHFCEIIFNPYKKSVFSFGKQEKQVDIVEGGIYKIPQAEIQAFRKKFMRDGISKKQLKTLICKISGRATQSFQFDGQIYFDVYKDQPCLLKQEGFPLASNCNYREDIVYKRLNDLIKAQQWKERLEELQRRDRTMRHPKHK